MTGVNETSDPSDHCGRWSRQEGSAEAVCLSVCASLVARVDTKLGLSQGFLRSLSRWSRRQEESEGLPCA